MMILWAAARINTLSDDRQYRAGYKWHWSQRNGGVWTVRTVLKRLIWLSSTGLTGPRPAVEQSSEAVEDVRRITSATKTKQKKSEFCLLFHNSEFILRFKKVSSIFLHGYLSPKKSCPCELCLAKYVRMKKNTERDLTHFFYLDLTCLSHCWDAVWKQEAEGVSSVWSCCSLKHQQAQTEARRQRFL